MSLPSRSQLDPSDTWNLESIFPSDDAWEARYAALAGRLGELGDYRGRLGETAATLAAALRQRDHLLMEVEVVLTYAQLRAAEDESNARYQAIESRADRLSARATAAAAWYEPELLALDPTLLRRFLDEDDGIAVYRYYIETLLRRRPHVRSAEVEALLAESTEPLAGFAANWRALHSADLTFAPVRDERGQTVSLQQNGQYAYLTSPDRRVRRNVWERYHDAYLQLSNTFAANYAGEVKRNIFIARSRGYASALDAALAAWNTPPEVLHNLLDALDRNIEVWRRYFRVQARLLGVERLSGWDLSEQPIALPGWEPPRFSFAEGVDLILASLAPMGEEYVGVVAGDRRPWVDVWPNVGKSSGAFSGGAPGTHPFILLNFTGQLGTVSTLTHELGHSMHSFYAWRSQPEVYAWYGDVVSETASNLHQVLLAEHILRTSDDPNLRMAVIQERMGGHLRYLFNMVLLARFEMECYERVERGDALTADWLIEKMADLHAEAYGDTVVLDRARTGIRWATLSHLFLPFYVYSYGAGTAAACAIGRQVIDDGGPAVARVLTLFKAGGSMDQHEAIRLGGADLRDPAVYQAAFDTISGYVDRLEVFV